MRNSNFSFAFVYFTLMFLMDKNEKESYVIYGCLAYGKSSL